MKINQKQLFSALVLSFVFLAVVAVGPAQAQVPLPAAGGAWNNQVGMDEIGIEYGEPNPQAPSSAIAIVVRLINYSLLILGILFVVLLIMSGYQWMTAGGNQEQVEKAQSRIKNAIIGLVIVLSSWGITEFVFYKMVLPSTTGNDYYKYNYDNNLNHR
ncbi:hypothetical protein COT98_04140 [Candidatus Falkowbacteria bacterium CG10_big_fil_rev_8_21_14_0_10_39_9]|uniref:DUF5671 domain-containing protein n=1 Tax=Candidatus Falkowbacteria bacterium CG10_big_fil_rev_8_21_14_0_10_39_9 TaxID=1974566 RepID=A0A2M6WNK3_9BACT|nr:MAG: hypothetical protein COT98_04140 [Candidatus Falkowbacteria bacterium CG10_big_fil_rev_8_21_14_0_10_39_9]